MAQGSLPPEELLELYQTGHSGCARHASAPTAHFSDWGRGDNPPAWES